MSSNRLTRCTTTLPIERYFARLKRCNGYASMNTISHYFGQMAIENAKTMLSLNSLHWAHPERYKVHQFHYPLDTTTEYIIHLRTIFKPHRSNKMDVKKSEVVQMRKFSLLFKATKQHGLRQQTVPMRAGTLPFQTFIGRTAGETKLFPNHGNL